MLSDQSQFHNVISCLKSKTFKISFYIIFLHYINGSVLKKHNSSVLALKLYIFSTKLLKSSFIHHQNVCTYCIGKHLIRKISTWLNWYNKILWVWIASNEISVETGCWLVECSTDMLVIMCIIIHVLFITLLHWNMLTLDHLLLCKLCASLIISSFVSVGNQSQINFYADVHILFHVVLILCIFIFLLSMG